MERETAVGPGPFDPWPSTRVHLEWGKVAAAQAAARGDIVVVIDVLSFSTTVSVAIERGAAVTSLAPDEITAMGGPDAVAHRLNAIVVSKQRADPGARFTLSPASLAGVEPGDRLVLTSLNGASMVAAAVGAETGSAGGAKAVLAGSLRSASATARAITVLLEDRPGIRTTLVASGEKWSSTLPAASGRRPSIEDQLGAGAIAAALGHSGLSLSAEAEAASILFASSSGSRTRLLETSVSGRELIAKGFASDVTMAADIDATDRCAVRGADGFFRPLL